MSSSSDNISIEYHPLNWDACVEGVPVDVYRAVVVLDGAVSLDRDYDDARGLVYTDRHVLPDTSTVRPLPMNYCGVDITYSVSPCSGNFVYPAYYPRGVAHLWECVVRRNGKESVRTQGHSPEHALHKAVELVVNAMGCGWLPFAVREYQQAVVGRNAWYRGTPAVVTRGDDHSLVIEPWPFLSWATIPGYNGTADFCSTWNRCVDSADPPSPRALVLHREGFKELHDLYCRPTLPTSKEFLDKLHANNELVLHIDLVLDECYDFGKSSVEVIQGVYGDTDYYLRWNTSIGNIGRQLRNPSLCSTSGETGKERVVSALRTAIHSAFLGNSEATMTVDEILRYRADGYTTCIIDKTYVLWSTSVYAALYKASLRRLLGELGVADRVPVSEDVSPCNETLLWSFGLRG